MKIILLFILKLISGSRFLSKVFLNGVGFICKLLPDNRWKNFISSGISQTHWKDINFKARNILFDNGSKVKIIPHLGEFDFDALFYKNLPYELEVYSFLNDNIKDYDLIIDIGSNVGYFTLYAAKSNTSAKIISFEPSRKVYERLLENINKNNINNVYSYNSALSDHSGLFTFYEPNGHLTNGSFDKNFSVIFDSNPVENVVIAIDALELEKFIKPESNTLIKIDVEGYEPKVLKVLEPLLKKYSCNLLIEVLKPYTEELNTLKFLQDDYYIFNLTKNGAIKSNEFVANPDARDFFLKQKRLTDKL